MSRQNKVNPGMYTQRGRLTQDDAARELRKQRSVGSQHTWQPVKKDQLPRLESDDHADGTETTEDKGSKAEISASARTRAAGRATASKMAPVKKAKSTKAKKAGSTAKAGDAKKTTGKTKTRKATKTVAKRTASKPKRKAVLARNVGGGGSAPRRATKRRKS